MSLKTAKISFKISLNVINILMIFHHPNNDILNEVFNDIFEKYHYFGGQQVMIAIIKLMIAIINNDKILCCH